MLVLIHYLQCVIPQVFHSQAQGLGDSSLIRRRRSDTVYTMLAHIPSDNCACEYWRNPCNFGLSNEVTIEEIVLAKSKLVVCRLSYYQPRNDQVYV